MSESTDINNNNLYLKSILQGYSCLNGLCEIAEKYHYTLVKPNEKIKVLLVGNENSGKIEFLEWYTGDSSLNYLNRENVFNIITNGKNSLFLNNTNSHEQFHIVNKSIRANTIVSTSKANQFENIIFINTPNLDTNGLELNEKIASIAKDCDLVCVFIEPINIANDEKFKLTVNELFKSSPNKLKFYLN